jgi:valyl-tRNA synthetase
MLLQAYAPYIRHLAIVDSLSIETTVPKPPSSATAVVGEIEVYIPLGGLIDFAAEENRLRRELAKVEKERKASAAKLANAQFLAQAPAAVIAKEREKQEEFQQTYQKLQVALQRLAGLR